ncbi:MAG: AlkA N-terminal domain-containing protein, partial [Bryobacteraceae bacterium]|nr:AlkA N-terminal domain-containing protein [Bryobacteraceae bacterium]
MPYSGSRLTATEHQLPYSLPYDYSGVLRFLSIRALPGVESVDGGVYRRTFLFQQQQGVLETSLNPAAQQVTVRLWYPDPAHAPEILTRVARILGIDHDPAQAVEHLSADPLLEPLVSQRPGLRIPGAWDPFEVAVRAVTGQQVTLSTATAMVARAAKLCGTPLQAPEWEPLGLTRLFPEPAQLA